MEYIYVKFDTGEVLIRETCRGEVTRFCTDDGVTVEQPCNDYDPVGSGAAIYPAWGLEDPPLIPPVEPTPEPRIITKLAFLNKFTDNELASVFEAAKVNVLVEVWLEKFKLADEVDLDNEILIGGLQGLEAANLLNAGRAAEILAS